MGGEEKPEALKRGGRLSPLKWCKATICLDIAEFRDRSKKIDDG